MVATTPPKGKPTPGKRDRQAAERNIRRQIQLKRWLWIIFAVIVAGLVVYFGSGTGGDFGPFHGGGTGAGATIGLL